MIDRHLLTIVLAVVRWSAPRLRADEVVRDLADDYARARHDASMGGARWWLLREGASVVGAYLSARVSGLMRLGPVCLRDLSLVIRGLRRGPLAALGAAAMLSTGLVAVLLTAGLSQALLFRQVSSVHGSSMRRVAATDRQGRVSLRLSYPELEVIRNHIGDAGRIAAVNMQPVVIRRGSSSLQTMAEAIDGQYLALVGAAPIIGRGLLSTDDLPSAPPAAVLSELFWRRQFAGSPTVLGQMLELNGSPFTIVGVLNTAGSSSFLGASVDAWVPIAHADPLLNRGWRTNVGDRWFATFALAARDQAAVDTRLAAAAAELAARHPEIWRERRLHTSDATLLTGSQRGAASTLAAILAGLAVLILATAASNLGGVFLARAAGGRRQSAIHLAIGSGRAAVVRRHALEGALIGLVSAGIALAVYAWVRVQLLDVTLLPTLALRLELPLTTTLAAGLAGVGALVGIALAAGPGLWASRVELAGALRDGDVRVSGGAGLARLRRLLVSAQVGLALVLMVGALRFTESLDAMRQADLGFVRDRLVAMDFDVEPAGAPSEALDGLAREALSQVAALPGVVHATMSNRAPIDQSTPSVAVRADRADGRAIPDATFYLATTAYFETVGIPLMAGRAFSEDDIQSAADVAIVNETLAAQAWPDGDVIGRGLYLEDAARMLRVVGVARDSKYRTIDEAPRAHFYRPTPPRLGLTLLARTAADPRETLGAMQRTLDAVGPGLVGFFPRTLDDHLAIELLPTRAAVAAASILGALALAFCSVGLYGLVSWFVAMRQREIGIRMALGASARDVRRLVFAQVVGTALPGLVVGVPVTIGLGILARAALFRVGPYDPGALAVAVGVILLIVALAAFAPARRATRVDPATSLRLG
jgi:predicted permease